MQFLMLVCIYSDYRNVCGISDGVSPKIQIFNLTKKQLKDIVKARIILINYFTYFSDIGRESVFGNSEIKI